MRDVDEQLEILRRGVEETVPEDEFRQEARRVGRATGAPLRVKYGIDPTGINVHLGHTVPLRKLRQFQDLGHTAVIIIGNYTALVGDPSGRDETRADADRGAGRGQRQGLPHARSAGSSTSTAPRSTTTATGSRSGRSSTSST